jgi:SAM-dependent methyltransferase
MKANNFLTSVAYTFLSLLGFCWLIIEFILNYLFDLKPFEGSICAGLIIIGLCLILSVVITYLCNAKYPEGFKISLEKVSEYIRNRKGNPKFLDKKFDDILDEFNSSILNVSNGDFITKGEDILLYAQELYAETTQTLWAVSFVDIRRYWLDSQIGNKAIEQQKEAIGRNISIERIFILQREEELFVGYDLFKELKDLGVKLFYAKMSDIPKELLCDFTIHDTNKMIQLLSFDDSTVNKKITETKISINQAIITKYSDIYTRLKQYSKALNINDIDNRKNNGKSVWEHKATREFYKSSSLNLHLDKIYITPTKILDIGCGAGRAIKILNKYFDSANILGIDIDPIAIGLSISEFANNTKITFEQTDFTDYKFADNYDIIVAYNSLYHSKKEIWLDSLQKIQTLLTPNGFVLLTIKTVEGNEETLIGATEMEENTWLGCNMPDYENLHHFTDEDELWYIESLFEVVYKEEIPLIKKDNNIVQAKGYYLILKNKNDENPVD